jgi:putative ABC transport system permease protein
MTYNHEPLIEVSLRSLALAAFPLFILAYCSWIFDIGIQNAILVGTFRTFIQLSILSLILDPIFMKGEDLWGLVLCYALLMITLSALEATSRSKFYFQYMFWYVLVLLLVDVTISSLFAFGIIMQLEPVWDPQYVIPIVGMLLGNCINGISLALNSMLTTVVDSSSEIELMLSFGANPYESSSRLLKEAIRTGSMPQLNRYSTL